MNTANLQLEGMLLALSALCRALREKGVMNDAEIADALGTAEAAARARGGASALRGANVEAIHFPIRFLRLALKEGPCALDFSSIAAEVGTTKVGAAKSGPGLAP